ncbi:MAG: SDR family oxidoreductase [Gammaproteobacteria bacterium]|nr:SDR family oxidoreductase [Gammaproteobacteria bacterium]MDH3466650.1 SDR family oxidoreductase [Gammaproteobacteria bacterium]
MRLENKVAIVTGAAQGIGFGIAEAFAAEGARVVLADVNAKQGVTAAERLKNAAFVGCDVGDGEQASRLVAETVNHYGRVDICVNNAGILRTGDVLEISEDDFDEVLRVNLKGSFLLSQAAARQMVEQGAGSIINMSSVNAVMTIPNILPYNVSKGGLNQLTRVMAVALADRGVRVNAIGPGSILTSMLDKVMVDDTARHKILSRTPMGRFGEVSEVAKIAVFLATDDSSYITGQCIYCDGGRMALNYVVPVAD